MHKLRRNSFGFSAIEGLILLVFVGLVVGIGWYVYSKNQTKSESPTIISQINFWTGKGGDNKWSNANNWSLGEPKNNQVLSIDVSKVTKPKDGTDVMFNNDISNLTISKLIFDGSVDGIGLELKGSPLTITSGIMDSIVTPGPDNSAIASQVSIDVDITFAGDQTVNLNSKNSFLSLGLVGDNITIGKSVVTLATASSNESIYINSPVEGSGDLVFNGQVIISFASPDFSGRVDIQKGAVAELSYRWTLGTASINVQNGGTLSLVGTGTSSVTLNNNLTLSGAGVASDNGNTTGPTQGAITACLTTAEEGCNLGTDVTLSGQVTLAGDVQLGSNYGAGCGTSESVIGPCATPTSTTTTYHITKPVLGNFTLSPVPNSKVQIIKP